MNEKPIEEPEYEATPAWKAYREWEPKLGDRPLSWLLLWYAYRDGFKSGQEHAERIFLEKE